jgi:ParB-like chromosome segregation protein Spo0J
MLPDDELKELAHDIASNGLLQPIVLDGKGQILDGRNRFAACELASVDPDFETYEGDDPATYALSVNLARRHLTKGQRAMVAARAGLVSKQAQVASAIDTTKTRISQAKTVLDHAPDLADAVIAGTRSLDDAYAEARQRKADLDSDERKLERLAEAAPDLADAVVERGMALNEALAASSERERERQEEQRDAIELLNRVLALLGPPAPKEFDAFVDAWAERIGPSKNGLPKDTATAGQVLIALAERIRVT